MGRGFVAAGSNVGDRLGHLRAGVDRLGRHGVRVLRISSVWETEPMGGAGPDWFLNLVVEVEHRGTPLELLDALQAVEREAGRVRTASNAPRELDLDILWLDDGAVSEPRLTVPHPRMWERRFVLAPLAELDPDLRDVDGARTVEQALAAARGRVRRAGPLGATG